MKPNTYAMIMAGGGGTRLWPLSRRTRPKQSLPLVTEETMFRVSVERLFPLIPIERIYVVTGADQVDVLRADVPELPAENFIIEPFARDNGPAAALGISYISAKDPDAIIAYLPSDHHITDEKGFLRSLEVAFETAQKDYIVTLGISPSFPSTAFGYIKRGEHIDTRQQIEIVEAVGFREKPDIETAAQFITSGQYCWNAGMFIWQAKQAQAEFERQQPEMFKLMTAIEESVGTLNYQTTLEELWGDMPKIALDYAIMEHAERMVMLPVDIGWSDIGSWAALYDVLAESVNGAKNVLHNNHGELIALDSSGSLIHSERLVVTIGMEDIVVVDTDDVLLICRRDKAQDVRAAVNKLKENGRDSMV